MKSRQLNLTVLLLSNLLVGAVCYWFGSGRAPSSPSQPTQPVSSSLLSAAPSNLTRDSNPAPSQTVSPSPSSSPTEAVAGQGYRGRVEANIANIGNMDTEEVMAELRALQYLPGSPDTIITQQMLLARLTELDPENAIRYATTLRDEMSVLSVMNAWTAADPKAASAYLLDHYEDFSIDDVDRSVAAGSIAAEWARQDSEAALAWAATLPDDVRAEAYGRIVAQLTTEDPSSATAVLEELPPGRDRLETLMTMVDQWAYQDPQAAAQWVVEQTDGVEQRQGSATLMTAWMGVAPLEASEWLGGLPEGTAKDSAIIAMTQTDMVSRDPEANAVWSASIQDPTLRERAVQIAVARWSANDPAAAQAWLQSQSNTSP